MKSFFKREKSNSKIQRNQKLRKKPKGASLEFGFLDGVLTGLLCRNETLGLLQVGANDGVTVDPVRDFLTRNRGKVGAVLVEPLPDVFEILSRNYKDQPRIRLLNAAVGLDGPLTLYRIRKEYNDKYSGIIATGITSVDREFVLRKSKHLVGIESVPLEDRIEPVVAPGYTVTQIILENEDLIGRSPFLQVDAEGFDDEVIRSIDFTKIRPIAISFEISNLGDERRTRLHELLTKQGYTIFSWSDDEELALSAQSYGVPVNEQEA